MKTRKILLVSVAVFSAAIVLGATTDAVSPELARKAVRWHIEDFYSEDLKEGYRIEVSEPTIYSNFDRTLKYYAFYLYNGPGEMPSWSELEKQADDGRFEKDRWLYNIVISGTKKLPPFFRFDSGPPRVISNKKIAGELLEKQHPKGNWRFVRAFIEGMDVYYIFRSGKTEVLTDMCGAIVRPENVRVKIELIEQDDMERCRKEWNEIEAFTENKAFWNNSSK